ncbi:MAG: hypothetical protein WKF87_06780 [Chryseolinea sp.]
MAIIALTNDQRVQLENNSRFQNLVRMAVFAQATYWRGLDGSAPPNSDHVRWAKSRFLASGIVLNPLSQDFASWTRQFVILTKDVGLYDNANTFDIEVVLDYMLANYHFDALVNSVFDLRIIKIEF